MIFFTSLFCHFKDFFIREGAICIQHTFNIVIRLYTMTLNYLKFISSNKNAILLKKY